MIDQLGRHSLTHIIHAFAETSNDAQIFMAKWDIKECFWCLDTKEGAKGNFAFVLPQCPGQHGYPAGPTTISKSNVAALLCLLRLALELSVRHHLALEAVDEVEEEEEEEEHAEDRTNNELVNPAVDDGTRCGGGCGRRCVAAVAVVATITVWSGHEVSANLVQEYCRADVELNKPTDVKLRCTPHHLIDVVDPPLVVIVVVVNDVIISYNTILYS